ncbi:hypothetical protein GCM10027612_60890 [Microbispora bryophytorum subsp. camponoti]
MRRRNLGDLLRHVHLSGALSRSELADRMGLNRSTIMALTAELSAAGLVGEELPGDTGRAGRPSLVVRPERDRAHVLAFDVRVDRLVAARVGLGGEILDRREAVRPARARTWRTSSACSRASAASCGAASGRVRCASESARPTAA